MTARLTRQTTFALPKQTTFALPKLAKPHFIYFLFLIYNLSFMFSFIEDFLQNYTRHIKLYDVYKSHEIYKII